MTTKLGVQEAPALYKVLTRRLDLGGDRHQPVVGKLREFVRPRREKVNPQQVSHLPYVGMEHVEAHTMRLLGTANAATMKSSANRFFPGDVLYGRLRPYLNKVHLAKFEGVCSPEFIVMPQTGGLNPEFLRYRLNSHDFVTFATHLNAGDRPRVDFEQISEFAVALPNETQQAKIVAYLDEQVSRLDASVAALHRVQANLERYRASVLKSACEGRLVPTEAELARQEGRGFETGARLLQRVLAERAARWTARGIAPQPTAPDAKRLPALPDGWVWVTAEQICGFITKGTTPSASKLMTSGDVQFLKVYNLTDDGVLNHAHKPAFVSRETHEGELARSMTVAGDVLMNIVGPPLSQVSVVPPALPQANINQAIARFRTVLPEMNRYLAQALLTKDVLDRSLREAKTTVGQVNLTLQICREIAIPLPPLAEQHRIVAEADRRLSLIRVAQAQVTANLARAQRLRQSILHAAFAAPATSGRPVTGTS